MDMRDASHPLAPGALLAGRYLVGERIGRGGSATVHRARDEVLGRDVALKVLAGAASDAATRERERLEIDLLATLSHRALVTIYDAVPVTSGALDATVLVMELVDGPTLGQRRAHGPIADAELLRLAQDLAEALAVVHAAGVVHRDVKPSNILLAPSSLPEHEFDARLADFGIAAVDGGDRITATGAVLGTAAYLSPEQATGGDVGPSADVYALGLVLLETITGERTFPGPAIEALTARMLRDPVIPPTVDGRWATLLRAMTSREPSERPTTDELRTRLAALATDAAPTLLVSADGSDVATTTGVTAALPLPTGGAPLAAGAAAATAPMRAHALDGDSPTGVLPVTGAASGDVEPAARRRRILVGTLVGAAAVVVVALGVVALQALPGGDPAPSAPADVAELPTDAPASPASTPSEPPSPSPTPAIEPSPSTDPSPTETSPAPSEPAPQPTQEPTQEPTQPPTTSPEPTPSATPEPSEPAPTESSAPPSTEPSPAPTP